MDALLQQQKKEDKARDCTQYKHYIITHAMVRTHTARLFNVALCYLFYSRHKKVIQIISRGRGGDN